ncbi:MAG TPA: ABC transporter substrate-binding protein [Methylomirabilota bacterium]|nr:ABC transporter substrate-binding protein [Methylomirabilota bacterium]
MTFFYGETPEDHQEEDCMTSRRTFLKGAGAVAAGGAIGSFPLVARAQAPEVKIGVVAIRAGIAAPVGTAGLRGTEWWAERVNKAGGILGRQVKLVVEEESTPKDTVERYRKLVLQDKVEVVLGGISTGVTLALAPVAEDLGTPWLSWDGTTQKGVDETMPKPKWAFKSVDNEVEAIVAGILTPKYFGKNIKTVAGIGNDYSYGHDCWQSYQAVLKKYVPDVKFVLELFPKLGVTDFTSHIASIQQSKADLLMCSFWSGDATIIMKQAAAVGLFKTMKAVFTTAGGVHDSLKKEFTPEGVLLGYNTMYFDDPKGSPLLKQFVREYKAKYNEYPPYECDHAYFCAESYRVAVEKAAKGSLNWPSKADVVKALEGLEVDSLSGKRSWREDHIQMCNFYQGMTTHKNSYDFVTIDPIEVVSTKQAMKPSGAKLMDWIAGWKV